jgi:hypothetical protein
MGKRCAYVMEIKNALDMDLRNRLREELQTLRKYEQMFDEMTSEEKYDLREWIVNGNSVNSNPFLIYGENGCLMDYVEASRAAEDMANNPEEYGCTDAECRDSKDSQDADMPF